MKKKVYEVTVAPKFTDMWEIKADSKKKAELLAWNKFKKGIKKADYFIKSEKFPDTYKQRAIKAPFTIVSFYDKSYENKKDCYFAFTFERLKELLEGHIVEAEMRNLYFVEKVLDADIKFDESDDYIMYDIDNIKVVCSCMIEYGDEDYRVNKEGEYIIGVDEFIRVSDIRDKDGFLEKLDYIKKIIDKM